MTTVTSSITYPPPRDHARPFDPPPLLLELQESDPVCRVQTFDGLEPWLILRYEDAKAVLLDDSRFSIDPTRPGFPEKTAGFKATIGQDRNLRTVDNPEHKTLKRMVIRDFTIKRLEALRPAIQAAVDELIDGIDAAGGVFDLVAMLALPVPTTVICDLLGVPYEDREFFGDRSVTCFMNAATAEEAATAGEELYEYLSALVGVKERSPADDMISVLAAEYRAGNLSREQAVDMARLMLVAGHETTANQIALSCLALLVHERQLDELRSDGSILTNSVDELLRYLSVAHLGRRRAVLGDVEIRGHQIGAGEGVIVANNVADRDPRVFADPHELDLRRPNAKANLAFGYGIHQCIGQQLSRVELQVIHGTLWRRLPSIHLAVGLNEIEFKDDAVIYGVKDLPVHAR
jgi:cytochrome P450